MRRGVGKSGFPQLPDPREGLGGRGPPRNNLTFIPLVCGAAAWASNTNRHADAWRRFIWLGDRDSNPNYLSQNQAFYR